MKQVNHAEIVSSTSDRIRSSPTYPFVLSIILCCGILLVFGQVRFHDFIDLDDDMYITENKFVKEGLTLKSICWAFKIQRDDNTHYHPITWLSHMLDYQLFGLNPGRHHQINLLFHIFNSVLLFIIFKTTTHEIEKSFLMSCFFAFHPLTVESVAWAAERKDVLSTFFWMLTTLAYIKYTKKLTLIRYVVVVIIFCFGLLTKPMLVTLPCTLLLLDLWPLKRIQNCDLNVILSFKNPSDTIKFLKNNQNLLFEKIPLLFLSLGMVAIDIINLSDVGTNITSAVPFLARLQNAIISYMTYIGLFFWPFNMSIFYPFPNSFEWLKVISALVLILSVFYFCIKYAKDHPAFIVGWLWFFGTLIPVIGFIQTGLWPEIANRWAYIPFIGLYTMIFFGFSNFLKWPRTFLWQLPIVTWIALLMIITTIQVSYWKNSRTLFERAISNTTDNYVAHNNLGVFWGYRQRFDLALYHHTKAVEQNPTYIEAVINLGIDHLRQNNYHLAIETFLRALKLDPTQKIIYLSLQKAYIGLGKISEGLSILTQAQTLFPNDPEINQSFGMIYLDQGLIDKALQHLLKAAGQGRIDANLFNYIGVAWFKKGNINEAQKAFRLALKINPQHVAAHNNLKLRLPKEK